MRTEEAVSVLGESQLFGNLDQTSLDAIAERAVARRFRKGDVIFHQEDFGDTLYVVAEGLVKVYVISEEGDEMVLATLRPPETFGEIAVMDRGRRAASTEAIEATVLLAFTQQSFLELLKDHPALTDALYRSLGRLLRRSLEQASDLVFLDLPGRLAKLLIKLGEDLGQEQDGGVLLDLDVTQTTLAGMIGGSRPSVNQVLRSFQSRGYVELQGRQMLIKRPDLLRRRAAP